MQQSLRSQAPWGLSLAAIIAVGILSRVFHTGWALFDKYLGDALYAAMVYVILRLVWRGAAVVVPTALVMIAIELFQLTLIPAQMAASAHPIVRLGARLIGTEFSFLDLASYIVGIVCIYFVDGGGARPACA